MIGWCIFFCAILAAAFFDIWKREIPDTVHILLLISGLVFIFGYREPWVTRLIAFLLMGITALVIGLRFENLGGGDIKMIASLAFATGFFPVLYSMIIALFTASLAIVLLRARKIKDAAVPLAPFLAAGCTAVFILQQLSPIEIHLYQGGS